MRYSPLPGSADLPKRRPTQPGPLQAPPPPVPVPRPAPKPEPVPTFFPACPDQVVELRETIGTLRHLIGRMQRSIRHLEKQL